MKIYYDNQVDAFYIELRPLKKGQAKNVELNEGITANYAPDGKIAGIEILDASTVLGKNLYKVSFELPKSFAK